VRAVEQRRTHHAPLLPEAIDASLALLVARGIPREIVVNDRVEVVLEVHTLGEAVGGDEDALPCIAQQLDFLLALVGGQLTRGDADGDVLDLRAKVLSEVMRRRDVAAEYDRVEAFLHKLR